MPLTPIKKFAEKLQRRRHSSIAFMPGRIYPLLPPRCCGSEPNGQLPQQPPLIILSFPNLPINNNLPSMMHIPICFPRMRFSLSTFQWLQPLPIGYRPCSCLYGSTREQRTQSAPGQDIAVLLHRFRLLLFFIILFLCNRSIHPTRRSS